MSLPTNNSQTSMILSFKHIVLEGMHAEVLWTLGWRYYSNSREGDRTRDQMVIKQTCYQPGHSGPTCFSKYLLHHNSNLGTQGHFHTKVTFSTTTQSTWLLRLVIPSINSSKYVTNHGNSKDNILENPEQPSVDESFILEQIEEMSSQ